MSKYGPEIIEKLESMSKDMRKMTSETELQLKHLNDFGELTNIFSPENIQEFISIVEDIKNSEGIIDKDEKEIVKRVENLRNKVR